MIGNLDAAQRRALLPQRLTGGQQAQSDPIGILRGKELSNVQAAQQQKTHQNTVDFLAVRQARG
jgi:hypothetical protein